MRNDSWLGLFLLAALGVMGSLLAAPSIPLADPDEGLHAAIAQRMVESGDWIVPRMLDEPFLDKPVLYFWAIALSLKILGMSEAAVRLPGLLLGMFGVLTTAAFAGRMLGRRIGLIAGLFYATMFLPVALVQLPTHDVALVAWVNLALFCFWESDWGGSPQRAWAWTVAAGAVLGLAVLTKGLAGVALAGISYGGYLIVSRRLRPIHGCRAGLALAVAAIVSAWWYLAMERANPGYLRYYFFGRHMLGFLTNTQPHGLEPWWYYFPVLAIGGLPWIAYLPVLIPDAVNHWAKTGQIHFPRGTFAVGESAAGKMDLTPVSPRDNRPLLLLACWFVGCTLFLTLARSKFITYVWPVFPATAILAAIVWVRKIDGVLSEGAERWMSGMVWLTCLIGSLGLPAALAYTQFALPLRFSLSTWTVTVVAGLTSLVPLGSWLRGRVRLTLGLAATSVCGQLVILLFFALPQIAAGLSGRDLAAYFNRARELPSRVLVAQERIGSLVFYLDRNLRSQLQPGQMANLNIEDALPSPALGTDEWIVIPERDLQTALKVYDLSALEYERAGRFRLYRRSDLEPHRLTRLKVG